MPEQRPHRRGQAGLPGRACRRLGGNVVGVREAGFTDAELVEVMGTVAINTFANYYNRLARAELDFPRVPVAV